MINYWSKCLGFDKFYYTFDRLTNFKDQDCNKSLVIIYDCVWSIKYEQSSFFFSLSTSNKMNGGGAAKPKTCEMLRF